MPHSVCVWALLLLRHLWIKSALQNQWTTFNHLYRAAKLEQMSNDARPLLICSNDARDLKYNISFDFCLISGHLMGLVGLFAARSVRRVVETQSILLLCIIIAYLYIHMQSNTSAQASGFLEIAVHLHRQARSRRLVTTCFDELCLFSTTRPI